MDNRYMKRNVSIICMSFLLSLCATSVIADEIKLKSETDRISYSLGQQIGRDFKRQGVDMDGRLWCVASTTHTAALSPYWIGRR